MEITGSSQWRHVQGPSPLLRVLLPLLNVFCPPWGRHGGWALTKAAVSSGGSHSPSGCQQMTTGGCLGYVGGAQPEEPQTALPNWLGLEFTTSSFSSFPPSPFSCLLLPSGPFLLPPQAGKPRLTEAPFQALPISLPKQSQLRCTTGSFGEGAGVESAGSATSRQSVWVRAHHATSGSLSLL